MATDRDSQHTQTELHGKAGAPHSPSHAAGELGYNDDKHAHGPGPADPYDKHDADGRPVVSDDELRVAGVKRIEAISAQLGPVARFLMYFGCFLTAYAYSLDGSMRYTYQTYATASYSLHSLLATINVVRSVIGAAAQPAAGKIADVFGRLELLLVSIVFFIVGTIIEATSNNVETFCAGAVFYELGYTMAMLLIEVIIGDLSSLRSRVFFSFVPAMPFLINSWTSPLVLEAGVGKMGERTWFWRWGIGMWAIIYPICTLPLIGSLIYAQVKAKRAGALADYRSPFQRVGPRLFGQLFWQLDVLGIFLIIVALGFFLTPFTLASGGFNTAQAWSQAKVIAPLVVGFCFFPVLFFWEKMCKYPMIPFKLLRDRGIWAGFLIAMFVNAAWYMQYTFSYAVLIVAFGQTPRNTAFIQNTYSFTSTVIGIVTGLVVIRVGRLKAFICTGVSIFMVGFGLLVRYRGSPQGGDLAGYIAAEILLGIGAGMFTYPTQAAVQALTQHARMAVVTGLYLASYRVGSAIGSAISGAVWTQRMVITLADNLGGNQTLASAWFADPYTQALTYPMGTPERTGAIVAFGTVQRILAIIGLCLCIPLVFFAFLLRDPKLGKAQSNEDAEMTDEEKGVDKKQLKWWSWKRWQ